MNAKTYELLDAIEDLYKNQEVTRNAFGIKFVDEQARTQATNLNNWFMQEIEGFSDKDYAFAIKTKKELKKSLFSQQTDISTLPLFAKSTQSADVQVFAPKPQARQISMFAMEF